MRPQFFFVSFTKNSRIKLLHLEHMVCIVPVLRAIAFQLRQNVIVWIWRKEPQTMEPSGEYFGQPRVVVFRQVRYGDALQPDFVFISERRPLSSDVFQIG